MTVIVSAASVPVATSIDSNDNVLMEVNGETRRVSPALFTPGASISNYTSRAAFVAAVGGGLTVSSGTHVIAGGLSYVHDGTSNLPGLPGFAPVGDVYAEHGGAVGDGATDDTAAIQGAIAAALAGNGRLRFTRGKTYKITSTLNITGALDIDGYGAILSAASSQFNAIYGTASNVSISGLEIVGAGNSSYNASGILVKFVGTDNGAATAPTFISNIRMVDCVLHDAGRAAIQCQFISDSFFERNRIDDVGYAGAEFLSCDRIVFMKNIIRDVTPGSGSNTYGVYFSASNVADLVRHPICNYCHVIGNHIQNVPWEGIDCHGANFLSIKDNYLKNCGDNNAAIAIVHRDDEVSTPIDGADQVTVAGNIIEGAQSFGIALTTPNVSAAIHTNIAIVGNTIKNAGDKTFSTYRAGLRIGDARGVTVSGNTFDYCAPVGIVIGGVYADAITITGNSFNRIVSDTRSDPTCIRVDRGASGTGEIVVSDNICRIASAGETYEAVYGFYAVSTDGGGYMFGPNKFSSCGTQYVATAAQIGTDYPTPIIQQALEDVAVTTGVSFVEKTITMPVGFYGTSTYEAFGTIAGAPGNENATVHTAITSATQIRFRVYTVDGTNFAAADNVTVSWLAQGW